MKVLLFLNWFWKEKMWEVYDMSREVGNRARKVDLAVESRWAPGEPSIHSFILPTICGAMHWSPGLQMNHTQPCPQGAHSPMIETGRWRVSVPCGKCPWWKHVQEQRRGHGGVLGKAVGPEGERRELSRPVAGLVQGGARERTKCVPSVIAGWGKM